MVIPTCVLAQVAQVVPVLQLPKIEMMMIIILINMRPISNAVQWTSQKYIATHVQYLYAQANVSSTGTTKVHAFHAFIMMIVTITIVIMLRLYNIKYSSHIVST